MGHIFSMSFPDDSGSQEPTCNAGDPGSIPGLRRSPGKGMDTHFLQCPCLKNPMGREAW